MRQDDLKTRIVPGAVILAIVAGGSGFGLARLTARTAAPPPPAPAETTTDTVKVRPADLQVMNITVEPAEGGDLAAEILAPAMVAAAPGGEAIVTAHAAGALTRLETRLGDAVKAGETLAVVQSADAAKLAADRSAARARLLQAREAATREQDLFDQGVSPRQDLEAAKADLAAAQAEALRADSAAAGAHVAGDGNLRIVSPISGRVTSDSAVLGAYVAPEAELFRVSDPHHTQLQAQIPAVDAGRVQPGDLAGVTAGGGPALKARVASITPALDPETRTATAVLTLDPGAPALTPGAPVQAVITPRAAAAGAVVLPDDAIQNIDGRDAVFVRTRDGFRVRPVVVSARSGGRASVVSGLRAGEQVATHNAFLLKAEMGKSQDEDE